MPPTPVRPLIDRILDGNLDALLAGWKAEGLSPNAISRKLLVEHDVDVSDDTIRRWLTDLEASS